MENLNLSPEAMTYLQEQCQICSDAILSLAAAIGRAYKEAFYNFQRSFVKPPQVYKRENLLYSRLQQKKNRRIFIAYNERG